ncbi:tRNA (adenosine(37)-N6)-threonylcarbamoyltransferase complex dimerization subunit type 1 TsaB [Flavobacterium algicola]|uniref:tRNA (adenosine(37)-N6)-threonylcarbamoyltransferase complex dimerization subunit type 1 TsaB n=1 Tax=Flavobacterium algicola TaxID=556529 RepID=UPI001EFD26B3|nr:tRNA (adenosine(37)-N6)-threonylcarbamoyltransferase complex dimerization subunit type 1 TsaB [Flavobacterium algicola]MCG9791493.1 tRNA (adenosine(37)-N6)-threonylcarbamoyltransferase complex dimerization subunit type 1 TsaB [Flavobacterium algicola]
MTYILNIETATKNCSIAIAKDGETVVCMEAAEQGFSHAEKLHVFLENALQEAKITFQDLDAVAVSQGPGSYTGLRIGVSAAKGLCYALGIPLVAVDTLQSLASQATIKEGYIIPMLDARRMEVYSAIFSADLKHIRATQAEIITENSFEDIDLPVYFVGDCAEKCKTVLVNDKFTFLEEFIYPSAKEMSALSYELYKNKATVDVAYFEPFYLKDFMITTSKK